MSPTGASRTGYDAVLKDFYYGPIVKQLNDSTPLLQRLESTTDHVNASGRQVVVPLWTGRSGGKGWRAEGGQLPSSGSQVTKKAVYTLKSAYGAFRLSGHVIRFTRDDPGAFVRAMETEMNGIKSDVAADLARVLYGDGTATIGAALLGGSTTTVFNLATKEPLVKGQLYVGLALDVGTLANPEADNSASGPAVITAVNITAATITVSPAVTTAPVVGHFIFINDNAQASSVSNEAGGLQSLISSVATTVGGITEASEPLWVPQRDTAAAALTVDRMLQMRGLLKQAGGTDNQFLISDDFALRIFWNAHTDAGAVKGIRYNDPVNIEGGFETVKFGRAPLIGDYLHPWGKLHFVDGGALKIFNTGDWAYLDEDGRILKQVSGYDAWEGFLVRDLELGTNRRNSSGVITFTGDTSGV
jgi:hypothetical protein